MIPSRLHRSLTVTSRLKPSRTTRIFSSGVYLRRVAAFTVRTKDLVSSLRCWAASALLSYDWDTLCSFHEVLYPRFGSSHHSQTLGFSTPLRCPIFADNLQCRRGSGPNPTPNASLESKASKRPWALQSHFDHPGWYIVWRYLVDPTETLETGKPVIIWRVDIAFIKKEDWKYESSRAGPAGGGRTHTFGLHRPDHTGALEYKHVGTFIRRIDFDKEQVGIEYTFPIPAGGELTATKEFLSIRGDGSAGRIRTYDQSVNSRPLYH